MIIYQNNNTNDSNDKLNSNNQVESLSSPSTSIDNVNLIQQYIKEHPVDSKRITLDLKIKTNTLNLENTLKQYQTHFNNQTINYKNDFEKTFIFQSIISNLGILTDWPITVNTINSSNLVLNDTIREEIQSHILENRKSKATYLKQNPNILRVLHALSQQINDIDEELLMTVINSMYEAIFTSKDIYDFEIQLSKIVSDYQLQIPTIICEMEDLFYVILQKEFKNGIPEEPMGIANTNEKGNIMRQYYRSLGVPFSINSLMRIMENENRQGAHKKINLADESDNVFKATISSSDNQETLHGIVILLNGEEINQNSLIYSQLVNSLRHTVKETILSQAMKYFSGPTQGFQTNVEKLNQDSRSLINELRYFMNVNDQVQSSVISKDGNIIVCFHIEGNINNKPISKVRINNDKMDNNAKEMIENKILLEIKDEFVKNKSIYDIDLTSRINIQNKIESILKEYGISYGEYTIFNDEFIIETQQNKKQYESIEIKCNSNLLNSEQIGKITEACMKTSQPPKTAETMLKFFSSISGKSIESNTQIINCTPNTIGWNFSIKTKQDLFNFNPDEGHICINLLSYLQLHTLNNALLSNKFNLLFFDINPKAIFGEWKKSISFTPGIKLGSLLLNNGMILDASFNSNLHVIDLINNIFGTKPIKSLEVINPGVNFKIHKDNWEISLKYNFLENNFFTKLTLSDTFNLGKYQFTYNVNSKFDSNLDKPVNEKIIKKEAPKFADINKKIAMILAFATPEFILQCGLSRDDKDAKPEVAFFNSLSQSTVNAYLSLIFPSIEIFDSKQVLGQQLIKIIIIYGISIMTSRSNQLGIAAGVGLALIFNNQINYIVHISMQKVKSKDGTIKCEPKLDVYKGDAIGLYSENNITYNESRYYM